MQTSSSPGCGSGRQGPEEGRAQGHAAGKRGASIRTRVLGRGGILSDMALSCSNRQKPMTEPGRPREDEPRGFALLRSHPLPSPARQGTGRVAQGGRLRHAEDHEATSTRAAGPSLRPLRQPRAPASPASFFLAANSRPGVARQSQPRGPERRGDLLSSLAKKDACQALGDFLAHSCCALYEVLYAQETSLRHLRVVTGIPVCSSPLSLSLSLCLGNETFSSFTSNSRTRCLWLSSPEIVVYFFPLTAFLRCSSRTAQSALAKCAI